MHGDMVNIIGSSSFLEATGINGFISDIVAAWEACGSSKVERDQQLLGSSPSII